MRILTLSMVSAVSFMATALPARAGELSFFGTAKIKPTLYDNFDFNSKKSDGPALNEGGWASGEHVRAELRLGFTASGEKWKAMMLLEGDMILDKDTGDRSFYGAAIKNGQSNAGAEFGIERAEFSYEFLPQIQLSAGINIRAADIATGGMVFGDDHPFIELNGKFNKYFGYALGYLIINNRVPGVDNPPPAAPAAPETFVPTPADSKFGDWRAYYLKLSIPIKTGGLDLNISPFALMSDDVARYSRAYYFGAEVTGSIGIVKPYLEYAYVTGDFDAKRSGVGAVPRAKEIRSTAAFAAVELAAHKAIAPYTAFRYTHGDDNKNDDFARGFVGITDIGRFTGLLGMDGNILGEHLASGASIYNSPLYSYSPDRAVGGNGYGGIGNGSSGNNPGQLLAAFGIRGDLSDFIPKVSYKAQAFLIWYDRTGNLTNVITSGAAVDKYAGTTVDVQLKYTFSAAFAIDYIASFFIPGQGIKDQINAGTVAQAHTLTLAWTY